MVVRMERTVFPALSRPRNKSFAPGWALVERLDPEGAGELHTLVHKT